MKRRRNYVLGAVPRMGRPFNEVPTVKVQPRVLPTTAAELEKLQKGWNCTLGQVLDRLIEERQASQAE